MKIKIPSVTVIFLAVWFVAAPDITTAATLAAASVHELGHIAAAKLLNIGIKSITLLPLGADINFARMRSYREELITASAGAAANLIAVIIFLPLAAKEFFEMFTAANIALAAINLLPIETLDGGETLKSALSIHFSADYAAKTASFVSSVFLSALWISAVFLMLTFGGGFSLIALCSAIFLSVFFKSD